MTRKYVEEEIAQYLESQLSWLRRTSTVGTPGQENFFIGDLPPDKPAEAVGMYEIQGEQPIYFLGTDPNKKSIERPRVQFNVRADDFVRAREMAFDIYEALQDKDIVVGTTTYLKIRAVARPTEVTPDSENRKQFSMSFMTWREI